MIPSLWVCVTVIVLIVVISSILVAVVEEEGNDDNDSNSVSMGKPNNPGRVRSKFGDADVIPNQYVVIFRNEMVLSQRDDEGNKDTSGDGATTSTMMINVGNTILQEYKSKHPNDRTSRVVYDYNTIFKGVTIGYASDHLLTYLINHPSVLYIEEDVIYTLDFVEHPFTTGIGNGSRNDDGIPPRFVRQRHTEEMMTEGMIVPWNLDRIDQTKLPLDGIYHDGTNGDGIVVPNDDLSVVSVFVLDSGIDKNHQEFISNNIPIYCAFNAYLDEHDDENDSLCHDMIGHGTHMAGIIGGKISGVVKNNAMNIYNVKIARSDGTASIGAVLAGLDFVVWTKVLNQTQPTVINISLGGPPRECIDQAMNTAIQKGVIVVASAGNEAASTCGTHFPAGVDSVIAVGSMDRSDKVSVFSNIGECVNIFAPGEHIKSAYINEELDNDNRIAPTTSTSTSTSNTTVTITTAMSNGSGTSTAAAHVTGVVALYLQRNPTWTHNYLVRMLDIHSTKNVLQGIPDGTTDSILNMRQAVNASYHD